MVWRPSKIARDFQYGFGAAGVCSGGGGSVMATGASTWAEGAMREVLTTEDDKLSTSKTLSVVALWRANAFGRRSGGL